MKSDQDHIFLSRESGDLTSAHKYLKEGNRKMEPGSFCGFRDRTRDNGHKLKHRKCSLNISKYFFDCCDD